MNFLFVWLVANQSGTNFNAGRKLSMALSHILWILDLSRQYFSIKGSLETAQSYISWVLYWSGTESNTKEQVSATLTHILWVL